MVHDQAQTHPAGAERRPLQHFEIAVGIAERRNRTSPYLLVDSERLSRLGVVEVDVGQPEKRGRAVLDLKPGLDRRSDNLLRRHSVDPFGPWPHELDAAA